MINTTKPSGKPGQAPSPSRGTKVWIQDIVERPVWSALIVRGLRRHLLASSLTNCGGPSSAVRCYICAMTVPNVREQLVAFVAEREWDQFHTPTNLAKSISIEAGELLELFQWSGDADEARVRDELADVLTYCHLFAYRLGAEPEELILEKLATTRSKYPVEKSRGRSTKYTDL